MNRYLGTPLDSESVRQSILDIADKGRRNLFPWNGQFSPQLVEALLQSFAQDVETILDPFVGSGTVVGEAATLGKEPFGAEINPAAFKIAQTYRLMQFTMSERHRALEWVDERLADVLPDETSLFSNVHDRGDDAKQALLALLQETAAETERILVEALVILLDFHHDCRTEKIFRTWRRLRSTTLKFAPAPRAIHVLNADARALPLPNHSIEFVLTSPPYINVFNYHQQYRRSAEAVGWNLLEVAKAEIGSNRKHRGNRFLTVIQYCLDMALAFEEMARVCREGARIVLVVGRESMVRKTPFYNGDILANIAVRCLGWSFLSRQERRFMNRFGETICEDVLHFATPSPLNGAVRTLGVRGIAIEVLADAENRVPDEARSDLDEARARVAEVVPSPIFNPMKAVACFSSRMPSNP